MKYLLFSVLFIFNRTCYDYNFIGQKKLSRQSNFSAKAFIELHQYTGDNNESPLQIPKDLSFVL